MKLYRIALRNIRRNKRRSLLSGLAILFAAISIVFLFSILEGMKLDLKYNIQTYLSGAVRIRHRDFDKYERLNPIHFSLSNYRTLVSSLDSDEAVQFVSPRISFYGQIPTGGTQSSRRVKVSGQAVDFERERLYQNYENTLVTGQLPQAGSRECLVGSILASDLGLSVGDKLTILFQTATRGSNAVTLKVAGILSLPVSGLNKVILQIPLDTGQRILGMPEAVQEILVKVDESVESPQNVAVRFQRELKHAEPLSTKYWLEVNGMASYIELASRIYDIIALVFFLLASTVIINTTIMVIFERMKEIGTLGAMGMSSGQLTRLFFLESLFISVAGAFGGILIGTGIAAYLGSTGISVYGDMSLEGNVGLGDVLYPVLNFRSTVVVFMYSVLVSIAATWLPSRRAGKIMPVEALRSV